MSKLEDFISQLHKLKETSTALVNEIGNSENPLKMLMGPVQDEVKAVYVQEAEKIIDKTAERELEKLRRREGELGSSVVKTIFGAVALGALALSDRSELASQLSEGAMKGYRRDELEEQAIEEAKEAAKKRVRDGIPPMRGEEFVESLRKGMALPNSALKIFKEEKRRHAANAGLNSQ